MKDVPQERKNFVKINMMKNYKPKLRGAAFTTKMMAKKTNNLKFKARFAQKMKLEQMQSRDQVNAYGGLGKVGLDYQHSTEEKSYEVPAFSPALAHLNPTPKNPLNDQEDCALSDGEGDEEMLIADFE